MRSLLLFFLGVPIPIIILIALLMWSHPCRCCTAPSRAISRWRSFMWRFSADPFGRAPCLRFRDRQTQPFIFYIPVLDWISCY